jgi:HAD superfamily hydrolase (TIGR01549 family)
MVDFIKPDPFGFDKYFKDMGRLQTFLFIGDSESDYEAALNCKISYLDVATM